MKSIALSISAITLLAWIAEPSANPGSIGLYTDASGTTCSFSGDAVGAVTAYVVFRPDLNGVTAAQFSAPIPNCLAATFVNDTAPPGILTIGSSQTGISVALPGCYTQPVNILRINLYRTGGTTLCCEFPVLPDPSLGHLSATGCQYQDVAVTSVTSRFNADASCGCVGNSPPGLPSFLEPVDGSTGNSIVPQMAWTASDWDNNITEHDVYLGPTTTPPLVASGLSQPTYSPAPLQPLTQYYWRVVVRDAFGLETASPTWSFATRAANTPPIAPYQPMPANGAVDVAIESTLGWRSGDIDEDPLVFDVYFGTSATPPLVATDVAVFYFDPGALVFATTYYWRIVVRDPFGAVVPGPTWSFTTRPENYPPSLPFGAVPANGATDVALAATLAWSATDADEDGLTYDVHYGTVSPPPLVASGLTVANFNPGGKTFATTYYWQIVVHDDYGNDTTGPIWSFTTRPENYPPNLPANPNPPDGATAVPLNVAHSWSASDPDGGPLTFDVYFGTSPTPPLVASDLPTASYSPTGLLFSTVYYWRVVVRDNHGATRSGAVWSYTTRPVNFPPNAPFNPSPPNGSTSSITPTLTWQCVDLDGDPILFDVYFGTTTNPPLVATGLQVASYVPGTLLPGTTYRWKIVASDGIGGSTTGPLWGFTTTPNSPPNLPSSPSPPNGSTNRPLNTTLAWQCSDPNGDAITYDVYFGTTANPPLVASNVPVKSYNPGLLVFSTTYRWRIVARDVHGATIGGPTWSFTTKANSPPVLVNPMPANNALATGNPILSWTASDPDLQPLVHTIYFGTTNPPPFAAAGLTVPSYDPGPLPVATYYWRVQTSDGITITLGPLWTFAKAIAGDVVADGVLTMDDVACAMQIFMWNPPCGGANGYELADVDCSASVTPADARCIHQEIATGSCSFCDLAAVAELETETSLPLVTVGSTWVRADTLAIRLSVTNVSSLGAFGFYTSADPKLKLIAARRTGASSAFTALDWLTPIPSNSVVGAYSLESAPVAPAQEFVELLFDMSHALPSSIVIDGFVDDLQGAGALYIPLGSLVGAAPIEIGLALHQNYPNPFNPQTTIAYHLPMASERTYVHLSVHDLAGRVVAVLVDEEQAGGPHEVRWEGVSTNGTRVSSGVYFYILTAGGERLTRKLVLLK